MVRFAPLLIEVWREVGRHFEIGDSLDRLVPLLLPRLPLDFVLVRQIDAEAGRVDTLAVGRPSRATVPLEGKSERPARELERLVQWCRLGQVYRGPAQRAERRWGGLVPDDLEGEILLGPLLSDARSAHVLLLAAEGARELREDHEELFRSLLEPVAVAVENDRRLREMTSLREAVEADNRALLSRLGRQDISESVVGADTGLRLVMEQIELVAPSDAPVLILGETGSGKEVVARAIHTRSRRSSGPFLRVNCGAIAPELIDSELFGHERGSFTGAVAERKGWFERADGGTLFLDECGELPLAAQVRLLRILQDGMLERVGGERQQHVDVRIVAATHRDLEAMVAEGRFRQDLWYRIAVFPIRLPPLRERTSDIPALATHFAMRAVKRLGLPPMVLAPEDIQSLTAYAWPGNVRELAAVIERAAILGGGSRLDIGRALGPTSGPRFVPDPLAERAPESVPGQAELSTLDEAMKRHIEQALRLTRGKIEGRGGAAALLAINPHTLRARMRKLGVGWSQFRS